MSATTGSTGPGEDLRRQLEQCEAERQRLAAQIRHADQWLRSLCRHAPIGLARTNAQGRLLDANPALCRLLGRGEAELCAMDLPALAHPDDREAVKAALGELLEGPAEVLELGVRFLLPDGRSVPGFLRGMGALHGDGREPSSYVFAQADEAPARTPSQPSGSEIDSPEWFDRSLDGMGLLVDGRLAYANPILAKIFGYDGAADLEGRFVEELVAPEDRDRSHQRAAELLAGAPAAPRVYTGLRRDGTRFPMEVSSRPMRYRGQPALLSIVRDITDRRRTEATVRLQAAIVENMAEGAHMGRTKDLTIVYSNPAAERMFGYERGELLGQHVSILNAPSDTAPDETARQIAAELNRSGRWRGELENIKKDGTRFWSKASVELTHHPDYGEVWVTVQEDISDRKRADESLQLQRAQLRTLSRRLVEVQEAERRHLARELHDEVGQILTGLKLMLESASSVAPAPVRSKLDPGIQAIADLMTRVSDLSLDLRPAILDDFGLEPALDWLIGHCGVEVSLTTTDITGRLSPLVETAAYRIIQEALTNVAKHSQTGAARVRVSATGNSLHLEVQDEGVGFAPEQQERAPSTGGLLGMRERAVALGGQVEIDSMAGRGTLVRAVLPLG